MNSMGTYDHELTLIKKDFIVVPPGDSKAVETQTTVLCDVRSAGQKEFYSAGQSGLKPEYEFTIHLFEYEGQREVEFCGKRYSVIRTYNLLNSEEIQLVCGGKVGVKNGN